MITSNQISDKNHMVGVSLNTLFDIFSFGDVEVSNFEYFLQRRTPAIATPANHNLNPQRLLENLEKFMRIKDKIMRRRELNY